MADWQAFATAFLGDSAAYINERKDKAEDYADKLAEQAERNKGKLLQLRQVADAQNSFVGQARDMYASDAQIEAALDAGPEGLKTLVGTLDTLRSSYGSSFNADLVKEAAALPEAFSPTGNIDVYSRYGLGSQTMGDIEAPKGGWFARAMGTDAKARVRAEADAEAFGGTGMSVYDMAELDSVTGYTSRNSGSYLRYTQPKIFNPANTAEEQTNIMTRAKLVMAMDGYTAFDTAIANADNEFKKPEQVAAEVANLKAQQKQFLTDNLYGYIDTQTALFGESYLEAVGPSLQSLGLSPDNLSPVKGTVDTVDAGGLSSGVTENEDGSLAVTFSTTNEDGEATIDSFTVTVDGLVKGSNGTVLSPEQSAAVLDNYGLVSPAALAAAAEADVAEADVAEVDAEVIEDPIIKVGMRLLDGKDGDMTDYTRAYKEIMALDADQRSAYVEAYNDLESVTSFADVVKDIAAATPGIADSAAGKAMGYQVVLANTITAGLAKAYALMTGDRTTAAGLVADNPRRREIAEKMIAQGLSSTIEDTIEKLELEKGDDKGLFRFSGIGGPSNPNRARAVETQLLGSGKLGVFVDRLLGEVSKASGSRDIDTTEGRIDDLDKQFLADDKNFPQPAPRRYAPSTEQRLETPERRANASRDQRVSNEVNRRELTEGATKIAEMLSRPTSEVSQEELTNFIMEVNAKFGEDAVKAELQRVTRGGAAKGGTE